MIAGKQATSAVLAALVTLFLNLHTTGGLFSKQKVYIQKRSVTDYLYKYDLPAMTDFTYCFWLKISQDLTSCYHLSISSEACTSCSNQLYCVWGDLHGTNPYFRVAGMNVNSSYNYWNIELSDGVPEDMTTSWHKHCLVNKAGEYFKWFMDREVAGVLVEMLSNESVSVIPSGSAALLLQEQDAFKGGLDINQACVSKMSMFNMWDYSMSLDELNALGCDDQGNILNMNNLDYMGGEPQYVMERFPCPEVTSCTTSSKGDNSMAIYRKEGIMLSGASYSVRPSSTLKDCVILCYFEVQCQSANFKSGEQICELKSINKDDAGAILEQSEGTIHLSSVSFP